MSVQTRISVVTGGASGIGAACVRELAAAGDLVAVLDRDLAKAQTVAAEVGGKAFAADVADERSVEACAAAIERDCGPVAVLVNSAGIIQVPVRPHELPMTSWDDVVRVDQRGTYVACVAFARQMIARKRGSIVNIASIAGMRSMPLHAYAPAKAAVIAITECLAAEWGPSGIRVNAVSPGYTLTPALKNAIDRGERDVSALAANAALRRLVDPSEIGRVVAFLASDAASAMTGANVRGRLRLACRHVVEHVWRSTGGEWLAMLEIRGLSKSFGGVKATDNVSLDFADGSLTAVIGPNGAGKSTFFNLITGALQPDAGQILLNGVDMAGKAPPEIVRHGIGRAFQVASIFPSLTVEETMLAAVCADQRRAGVMHRRFPLAETRDRAEHAMELLGLAGKRNRTAATLSHGDQKLLDIALALVLEPKVLLLDEPTAGMGTEERWRMIDKVRELWEKQKITVVFIEHDMDIVFKIAPQIVVLCYGRILATGTPDAIRRNDAVIEAYLGSDDHAGAVA
ncbi:ABC-type branched-subunit amino acid transport system ATPase component/NAD(P)-dependent dehydrogenase (short-subunit alcohol dehydrogenase family) [Bradyrhizobium elkanii]